MEMNGAGRPRLRKTGLAERGNRNEKDADDDDKDETRIES